MDAGVGGVWVRVPNPLALSQGSFEQSEGLRTALAYRDKVSQTIIDREMAAVVRSALTKDARQPDSKQLGAFSRELLNDAWSLE